MTVLKSCKIKVTLTHHLFSPGHLYHLMLDPPNHQLMLLWSFETWPIPDSLLQLSLLMEPKDGPDIASSLSVL